jgi:glycosyltransferase involved in cell wall biosynthesis
VNAPLKTRILVVAHDICRPDIASGDKRFAFVLAALASFARVDMLIPVPEPPLGDPDRRYWDHLRTLGIRFINERFYDRIGLWCTAHTYDWILAEFWYVASHVLPAAAVLQSRQPALAVAIDSVDVHFLRELAGLAHETGREAAMHDILDRKARELAAYRAADVVVAVTQEDRQALLAEGGMPEVVVVPNVVATSARPVKNHDNRLLFIGGFKHHPNIDGISWFVEQCFPLIRSDCPDVVLDVVGSHPPPEVTRFANVPGVRVVGYVEDTRPWLDAAAVSVAPLRYGAGMKGKVTEALAAGVPVVTTSFGTQGLEARSGTHLLCADDAAGFAAAVLQCLRYKGAAERMGREGRDLVARICGEAEVRKTLEGVFSRPAGRRNKGERGWRRLRALAGCAVICLVAGIDRIRRRLRDAVARPPRIRPLRP